MFMRLHKWNDGMRIVSLCFFLYFTMGMVMVMVMGWKGFIS